MKYTILAIEREYASGGREVGRRVAQSLNIPYYNREILEIAAEKYGTSPEHLEYLEETATNSFLYSLYLMSTEANLTGAGISDADALYLAEAEIIRNIVLNGPAVIIGRCASHVLRDRKDVLKVFIRADMDLRRHRATTEYGISSNRVDSAIRKADKRRSNYYHANTSSKWDDPKNYHIVLDSGKLGIEASAELLRHMMAK